MCGEKCVDKIAFSLICAPMYFTPVHEKRSAFVHQCSTRKELHCRMKYFFWCTNVS